MPKPTHKKKIKPQQHLFYLNLSRIFFVLFLYSVLSYIMFAKYTKIFLKLLKKQELQSVYILLKGILLCTYMNEMLYCLQEMQISLTYILAFNLFLNFK